MTTEQIKDLDSSKNMNMIISCNGNQTEIKDSMEIQKFIQLTKSCTKPIQLRKMRVIDRYDVELVNNKTKRKFKFYNKNQMPFLMANSIGGNAYECNKMEQFLAKYK